MSSRRVASLAASLLKAAGAFPAISTGFGSSPWRAGCLFWRPWEDESSLSMAALLPLARLSAQGRAHWMCASALCWKARVGPIRSDVQCPVKVLWFLHGEMPRAARLLSFSIVKCSDSTKARLQEMRCVCQSQLGLTIKHRFASFQILCGYSPFICPELANARCTALLVKRGTNCCSSR